MKRILLLFIAVSIFAPATAVAESSRGQAFILADQDQSATLTREEFKTFINLLAASGHKNARRVKTFHLYSLAWARVDIDGDGVATRSELSSTQMAFGATASTINISSP